MKIGQKFNRLTPKEYFFYIDNYRKYKDFNTLGLYRSIVENDKLDTAAKIEVREYAHATFKKSFEFLQLKDPGTYFDISTLGQELTEGDERQIWDDIRRYQQKVLSDKKIRHRNFGDYSKHNCGYDNCPLNGIMIKEGSFLAEGHMWFKSDKSRFIRKERSAQRKSDRKNEKQFIRRQLEEE